MAAIALTSSIGLVCPNFYKKFNRTPITLAICVGIWLLAFAIISPHIFGYDLFGYTIGKFGWGPGSGRCDVMHVVAVITRVVAEAREASSSFLTPMVLARSSCLWVMLKSVEQLLKYEFFEQVDTYM